MKVKRGEMDQQIIVVQGKRNIGLNQHVGCAVAVVIVFVAKLLTADNSSNTSNSRNSRISIVFKQHVTKRTTPSGWKSDECTGRDCDAHKQGSSFNEKGSTKEILDLHGPMRKYFAYHALYAEPKVSVVCSPYSAMTPLGIMYFATGDEQIKSHLHTAVGAKSEKIREYFKKESNNIKHLRGVTTHLASRIYVNKKRRLHSKFKSEAESVFGSCVESVDMEDASTAAAEVNRWVGYHTDHLINKIISAHEISPKTDVMIVNAFYFSAEWEHKFHHTRPDTFHGSEGDITVKLMYYMGHFSYGYSKALDAQAIKIPYKGDDAFMLVLLPREKQGLTLLLNELKLAPDLINKIPMKETLCKLYLPKFKIETTLDLEVLYQKVGVQEIFLDDKGLDRLVHDEVIKVGKAIHKSIINVNEWGTTAASGSIVQGYGASKPMDLAIFRADHPFLYYIVGKKQQLFAGTFTGASEPAAI